MQVWRVVSKVEERLAPMILCSALDYYAKESEFYFRKKKVHDLRLINLSHPAHFKELQYYFEVHLLLMTFLTRRGAAMVLTVLFIHNHFYRSPPHPLTQ